MVNEKNSKKYFPGMRNIKTAVSIFIDLIIFELLGFGNPFYACIASVVCMQPTVDETVKAGKNRIIGTCIAAVIGLAAFYLGESFSNPKIYILLIPIGSIILIHTCVMLKVSSSASIACVIFISILTSSRTVGDNIIYPFTRLIETFVGIVVATIVNKYLTADFLKKFKRNKGDLNKMIIHCMAEELWNKRKNEKEWGHEEIEVEGFIHCSTVEYFWRVAESHFNNLTQAMVLLCIDESKLKSEVRYEDGDNCGRYYPHVYGLINNDAVINVLPFLKDKDGKYIKNIEFKDIAER